MTDADPGARPAGEGAAPEAVTTGVRTLDPRVRLLWLVRALVAAVGLAVAVTAVYVVVLERGRWPAPVVFAAAAVLGAAFAELRYRVWAYEVRADSLFLSRGVLTRVRTVVPYVRVQHVDTSRGPLERLVGLSSLVVYTAGSRGADVTVPGLTPAEAEDLQARLKQLAIEAEGGDAV